MQQVVTIDGPAGAGKSTVARRLADRLGWRFLDTGAMYRAVTLAAIRGEVDLTSESALAGLVESLSVRLIAGRVMLGEEDITQLIRGVEVTQASKFVADSPSVRQRLMVMAACVCRRIECRDRRPGSGDAGFSRCLSQVLPDGQRPRAGAAQGRGVSRREVKQRALSPFSAVSAIATRAMPLVPSPP